MILLQARLFFLLYYRPLTAFTRIIDEGSFLFGVAMVLVVSTFLRYALSHAAAQPVTPFGFIATILTLSLIFVPACILVATLVESTGSFGVVLRRDYGPLLTCTLMAWAASYLPVACIAYTLPPDPSAAGVVLSLWLAGGVIFAISMCCAVMVLFGTSGGRSVLIVILALVVTAMGLFVVRLVGPIMSLFGSPFVLYFLYQAFRGELGDIAASFRSRGNFRRQLEAAAINPHDADPHYQLGLIYQQRRQTSIAIQEFERAIAIDPSEADAHYQLGRIAREQGRLEDALQHQQATVQLDENHSFGDVWREIGAIYLQAGRLKDAEQCLSKFVDRREYDPEGLYLMGETLMKLNRGAEARGYFARAIEAVKTMPPYRRGQMRKWSKLAKSELNKLPD
jgi:hypothetical protein